MINLIAKDCFIGSRECNDDYCYFFCDGDCVFAMVIDAYKNGSSLKSYVGAFFEEYFLNVNGRGFIFSDIKKDISNFFDKGFDGFSVGCCLSFYFQLGVNAIAGTIGDTRIYWLSKSERTTDDSAAQDLCAKGMLSPHKIRFHPYRRYVKKSIPTQKLSVMDVDFLAKGQFIFLCSDGFWSQFDDQDIFRIRTKNELDEIIQSVSVWSDNASFILFGMN